MVTSSSRLSLPPFLSRAWRAVSPFLPPPNFITLHYLYFIGTCLLASIIFWGSSTPSRSISYTDSLFLTVSAMTLAGLNTVNLSEINTWQQIMLFFLLMLGSAIFVSFAVVEIRRRAFERRFKSIVEERKREKRARSNSGRIMSFAHSISRKKTLSPTEPEVDGVVVRGSKIQEPPTLDGANDAPFKNPGDHPRPEQRLRERPKLELRTIEESKPDNIEHSKEESDTGSGLKSPDANGNEVKTPISGVRNRVSFATPISPSSERAHRRVLTFQGVGARQDLMNHPIRTPRFEGVPPTPMAESKSSSTSKPHQYAWSGYIGRNSQFSSLTLQEREQLGGVEYRAIEVLAVIVPLYFVLWQLLGSLGLGAYIAHNRKDVTESNGLNPWWVGAFNAVSGFNNSGMSLLDANMVAFQTSNYMLLTMGLLILAGNTCYPVFLRLIIWCIYKILPDASFHEYKKTLRFLLDHPRRCYTTLFPSTHTWWLAATLVALNGIDWIAFEVLNIGNTKITSLPSRTIDGLFQALAVRSGGFYVVTIPNLRIGLLILYVLMMYISVYPVVITMRNSNIYEERSLGLYSDDLALASSDAVDSEEKGTKKPGLIGGLKRKMTTQAAPREKRGYFVRQQLRGQLAHDLWWIVLAILFINMIETSQFERDPVNFSVFNYIFEIISAYGCVGISVGVPDNAYSFCGAWHKASKLILCAVMIRGRHRGLPVAIDRAVLLPGEHLALAEEEDAQIRLDRAQSSSRAIGGR